MKSKAFDVTMWILGVCAFVSMTSAAGDYLYWRWIREYRPVITHGIEITDKKGNVLVDPVIKAGETVYYAAHVTTTPDYLNASCVLKRALVNGWVVNYDREYPPKKKVGEQIIKGDLDVPGNVTGNWFIRHTVECDNGPQKIFTAETKESKKFKVVSKEESKGPKGDRGQKGEPGKDFWGK